ncbi:MAG TPA: sulfotransferase [Planctomycetaceae bacterium]|nr:sulfotransferase [Planctomycetaceae bacterium]
MISSATPAGSDLRPAFIVGCPRSGTTLLASLCDRHSRLAATPETHFFSKSAFRRMCSERGSKQFDTRRLAPLFVESQYTRDLELSSQDLLAQLGEREIDLAEFLNTTLSTYAHARGKAGWIEKTPEHLLFADRIFEWYPQARMICIVRDGRDVALSLKKLPWSITPVRHYAALWVQSAKALAKVTERWPENLLTIRYESLLVSPVETMTEVMRFLGLEFEPQQLDPSLGTGIVPDWEMVLKRNVFGEIDPSRAFAWKKTATPKQLRAMHSMMGPCLDQLGYEPGNTPAGSLPVRMYDACLNRVFRTVFSYKLYWLRWWARVMLNAVTTASPYASMREARRRRANAATSSDHP